jgi:hypothetical protein
LAKKLEGELLEECSGWIAEQMAEEGYMYDGSLVELVLEVERELGLQALLAGPQATAARLAEELAARGIRGIPNDITVDGLLNLLDWEDQFLSFAGIPRAES